MEENSNKDEENKLPVLTKRRDFLKDVIKISSGVLILAPAASLFGSTKDIRKENIENKSATPVMDEPFLGSISIVSFNFAPRGWALCNGQLLPINQNQALFSLLGTTYGGDGRVNFALPDLRGRVPIHMGNGYVLGQRSGEESHTLITSELPQHTHTLASSSAKGNTIVPTNNYPAKNAVTTSQYGNSSLVAMNSGSITTVGGSQPHNNMMPYLTLNFVIALQGIFPSQN